MHRSGRRLRIERFHRRASRVLALAVFAAAGVAACSARDAAEVRDAPWADGAWMRMGTEGGVTGAYATIHNPRGTPIRIVGATSEVADTVELHETMDHDGMVHMMPQTALEIPAGDSVVFAPGGKHFMVRALRRDLVLDEQVPIHLVLDDGSTLDFVADVRPIGSR